MGTAGEGESRLREQLQNVQTAKRREQAGRGVERGRAEARRTGGTPTLHFCTWARHSCQILSYCRRIRHAVHVVDVSMGREK